MELDRPSMLEVRPSRLQPAVSAQEPIAKSASLSDLAAPQEVIANSASLPDLAAPAQPVQSTAHIAMAEQSNHAAKGMRRSISAVDLQSSRERFMQSLSNAKPALQLDLYQDQQSKQVAEQEQKSQSRSIHDSAKELDLYQGKESVQEAAKTPEQEAVPEQASNQITVEAVEKHEQDAANDPEEAGKQNGVGAVEEAEQSFKQIMQRPAKGLEQEAVNMPEQASKWLAFQKLVSQQAAEEVAQQKVITSHETHTLRPAVECILMKL